MILWESNDLIWNPMIPFGIQWSHLKSNDPIWNPMIFRKPLQHKTARIKKKAHSFGVYYIWSCTSYLLHPVCFFLVINRSKFRMQDACITFYNFKFTWNFIRVANCIDVVMISVLASIAVDHMFEHLLGQPTIYDIGTCCFSGKQAVLKTT